MNDWLQRYARGGADFAVGPKPGRGGLGSPPSGAGGGRDHSAADRNGHPDPDRHVYAGAAACTSAAVWYGPMCTPWIRAPSRDAIAAAGGFRTDANREAINLATPLLDGSQVHIPPQAEVAATPQAGVTAPSPTPEPPPRVDAPTTSTRSTSAAPAGKVNINTASLAEPTRCPA
ncbi:MAG: hypothetical protein HZY76_05000 [Anaerolineae bacterium]|nr:MAG: hypothetical protein HZY76_05000 [Anaerolineae bacterium]